MNGDPSTVVYGMLPPGFMSVLKARMLARYRAKRVKAVKRTE